MMRLQKQTQCEENTIWRIVDVRLKRLNFRKYEKAAKQIRTRTFYSTDREFVIFGPDLFPTTTKKKEIQKKQSRWSPKNRETGKFENENNNNKKMPKQIKVTNVKFVFKYFFSSRSSVLLFGMIVLLTSSTWGSKFYLIFVFFFLQNFLFVFRGSDFGNLVLVRSLSLSLSHSRSIRAVNLNCCWHFSIYC